MKTYQLLLRIVLFLSFLGSIVVTGVFYTQNWVLNPIVPTVSVALFVIIVLDAYTSRKTRSVNS